MNYSFLAPQRIVFGWGRRCDVGVLGAGLGRRAILVCGSQTLVEQGVVDEITASMRASGVAACLLTTIRHEPEVVDVDAAVVKLAEMPMKDGDFVVGLGGGSAIDLAKAVAALATNAGGNSVADYLEGVGRGLVIERDPLPVLAMPTTAGTGSEATKNAVISCYEPKFKKSLRSNAMVPRVVLVDPELAVHCPRDVTVHCGMDAITQLVESYISRRAQPIPRALALQGVRLAVPALPTLLDDPQSRDGREAMAHAALLSGMALANSGLGLAHGVAAALGVHARVPHGLACAVMLPAALRANRSVCETDYGELEQAIDPNSRMGSAALADAFVERVEQLCETVGVPKTLSALGVRREQLDDVVRSSRGNSMSGNPRDVSDDALRELLEAML
ncbi:MAG: iron-containing alcohol dehydrogenase [Pirellulales bacterium]